MKDEQIEKEAHEYAKQFWEWENNEKESIAFFAYINGMKSMREYALQKYFQNMINSKSDDRRK